MIVSSFAGELISMILIGLVWAVIIAIPVYIIWLLIKSLRKISRIDQVELELKKLQEEIRLLRESLSNSPKNP